MPRHVLIPIAWSILFLALLAAPVVGGVDVGRAWIRDTIRLSLLYYGLAHLFVLQDHRREARIAWTLAWLAYIIHVAMAFHFFHGWSHTHAYEHVRQASGFGEGIFVSYLLTLLWTLDVIWWWRDADSYRWRSRWITGTIHGFMAFMVFNATVVFETGFIRWAGVALFEVLARARSTSVSLVPSRRTSETLVLQAKGTLSCDPER